MVLAKNENTLPNNYDTRPRRGKMVQLLVELLDGHAAFTTLLRLNASFAIAPRVLHSTDLAAPDAPPVFKPKLGNLLSRWF
jgi:hypothetical protein